MSDLYLTFLHDPLAEHVGRADLRLFEAMIAVAPASQANEREITLSKPAVLDALERQEGRALTLEALRQRIHNLNEALGRVGLETFALSGDFLTIRSRKDRIVLELHDGALGLIKRERGKGAAKKAVHEDQTVPADQAFENRVYDEKPTYHVFVSHGHEDREVEEQIVKPFCKALERKLSFLSPEYREKFSVKLWWDHARMKATGAFADQTNPQCEKSNFAVFLSSNKWAQSLNCKAERQHFEGRALIEKQWRPYLCVQLSGQSAHTRPEFEDYPILPKPWTDHGDWGTLIQLWETGGLHVRDQFTDHVAEQICIYLSKLDPTPRDPDPTGQSNDGLRGLETTPDFLDVDERMALENRFHEGRTTSGDFEDSERAVPAVDLLLKWAHAEDAEQRVLAILGGFGMGKTVTVQRFAQALAAEPEGPVPVYLDLRRLVPDIDASRPFGGDLGELLMRGVHGSASAAMTPEELISTIVSGPSVLIIDGLDEIGNRIGRERTATLYREILEILPREVWQADARGAHPDWSASPVRIVVTCRTHFFRSLHDETATFSENDRGGQRRVRTLHMAPLALAEIEELFLRVLGAKEGARAFDTVQSVHDLPGLARRPIMAKYIGDIAGDLAARHARGNVINIATVYEALFERTLTRDDHKQPYLTTPDRIDLLKALAGHLHQSGRSDLQVDDLERWFDRFVAEHPGLRNTLTFGTDRRILQTEFRNASFLVRVNDDRFVFAHTSFYEYFLGLAYLDALIAGDVSDLATRNPSQESLEFCCAAAHAGGRGMEFEKALAALLVSNRPLAERSLAYRIRKMREEGPAALPRGANLTEFDLRDVRLSPGTVWEDVRLDGACLTGLQADGVWFRGVSFEGAWLGDAAFADCQFTGCSGTPKGLGSTRRHGCQTDADSAPVFADAAFTWPGGQPVTPDRLVLDQGHADWVRSVAFAPDGRSALTGSTDNTARLWDLETGREIRRLEGHADWV
ncbi:MAG: NACHT domain-containing protein, partial [Pseudomonadota bacterium]